MCACVCVFGGSKMGEKGPKTKMELMCWCVRVCVFTLISAMNQMRIV